MRSNGGDPAQPGHLRYYRFHRRLSSARLGRHGVHSVIEGIKLEVVDGVTTTDSEAELAEVKQMDALMYPFLKNSGFF